MRFKFVFPLIFASVLFFSGMSSNLVQGQADFSLEFGSFGTGDGKFKGPTGLALDTGSNLLYVADTDNDRIQIIDVDGNCDSNDDEYLAEDVCFVDEFGGNGNGEGEFDPRRVYDINGRDVTDPADLGRGVDINGRTFNLL